MTDLRQTKRRAIIFNLIHDIFLTCFIIRCFGVVAIMLFSKPRRDVVAVVVVAICHARNISLHSISVLNSAVLYGVLKNSVVGLCYANGVLISNLICRPIIKPLICPLYELPVASFVFLSSKNLFLSSIIKLLQLLDFAFDS